MIFVQPLSHSQKLFLSGRVAGLAVGCKKYLAPRGEGGSGTVARSLYPTASALAVVRSWKIEKRCQLSNAVCVVLSDVRDVFDLFDFWDGRDGMVDGAKLGDVMRCIGLNPTNKLILENGGSNKLGLLALKIFVCYYELMICADGQFCHQL